MLKLARILFSYSIDCSELFPQFDELHCVRVLSLRARTFLRLLAILFGDELTSGRAIVNCSKIIPCAAALLDLLTDLIATMTAWTSDQLTA